MSAIRVKVELQWQLHTSEFKKMLELFYIITIQYYNNYTFKFNFTIICCNEQIYSNLVITVRTFGIHITIK